MSRLEHRFLLAAAAAALIPLLLVWLAGWQLVRRAYLEAATARLEATADRIALAIDDRLSTETRVLTAVCRLAADDPAWAAEVALAALNELDAVEVNGRLASRFAVVAPGDRLPPAAPGSVRKDAWGEPLLRRQVHCAEGHVTADLRLRPALALLGRVHPGVLARLFGPGGALLSSSDLTELLGGPPPTEKGGLLTAERRLRNGWRLVVALPEAVLFRPLYRTGHLP